MPNRDLLSNIQRVHLGTLTLSGTTPSASAWVDLQGFDSAVIEMFNYSVTDAGTTAGFTAQLQEGTTTAAASAANVTGSTITVTSDTADAVIAGALSYVGSGRYARLNVTGTTGTDAIVIVSAILGNANVAPTTYIGASVAAT